MLRRNISHMLRFAPGTTVLLIFSLASIVCVIITVIGTLISLDHFFTDYRNVRYMVDINDNLTSGQLEPISSPTGDERIIMVSAADPKAGSVVVGIGGNDGWIPSNDAELLVGNSEEFVNLSSLRGKAYIDSNFYNLYENIEPWIKEVTILKKQFAVIGMANYYFSENEYDQVLARTENESITTSLTGGNLALYDTVNGLQFVYPNAIGTIIISAHDFIELNIPTAFISVVYRNPPTYQQYQQTSEALSQINGSIEPFRAGTSSVNLSHISALIYLVAITTALFLVRYLIVFLLDACEDIWRSLFIIGCHSGRIMGYIVSQFLFIYALSALLSFFPCRAIMNWLTDIGISVSISIGTQILLSMGCVLLLLISSMPAMLTAVRRYSTEDGSYVQSY